jgi:hypothetical protein
MCRRVCVLRERGHPDDAERLRAGELMAMVAAIRTPAESDAAVSERLNAIFAQEAERVANAAVLAELLAPSLLEKLQPQPGAEPNTTRASPSIAPPLPVEKTVAPRAGSIADFIDEMIAQEKPPARPGPGAQRRAS